MKIVVIGGTGLIGSKLVTELTKHGHHSVAASPSTGVNTLTGEGLAAVLNGAQVIVDVSNPPSFEENAVLDFFKTSTTNLLHFGMKAGIRHLVALSVVGTQSLAESAYFRAKMVQEKLIREGTLPYSIVYATQFFEFVKSIADSATRDSKVYLPPVFIQAIASDDVTNEVARISVGTPLNSIVEVAGPEKVRLDELIRHYLGAIGDPREVVTDPTALYFGVRLSENTLLPHTDPRFGEVRFDDWLAKKLKT